MGDQEENLSDEKRRNPRISGAVVEYVIVGEDPEKKKAFVKDISLDGICIFISDVIKDGALVSMEIYLVDSEVPIRAKGKVVWQKPGEHLKLHAVGVEFTDIGEEDKRRISECQ